MQVRGDWQGRLQEARELYGERFEDRLTLRRMANEVEGHVGEEVHTSYPTIQRHFADSGKSPSTELLRGLAKVLAVREEWLLKGKGEPTEEGQQRALRSAEAARAFRESVSEPFELPEAGEALLKEGIRRWAELPPYMFEKGDPQEPEEVVEELAEIMRLVLQRLPRRLWSERDWDDFSVALLGALMTGIKKDYGGAPKAALLSDPEDFVSFEVEELEISRPE